MTAMIDKLVKDLKWRLSSAGRRFKPSNKEIERWAPLKVPAAGALLLWAAYLTFALLGADPLFRLPELAEILLFGVPGWIVTFLLLTQGTKALNKSFTIKAYRRLLQKSERFTLVEYNRYLSRRIKQAGSDAALGGMAEVSRLKSLQRQLGEMLKQGLGEEGLPIESEISKEAEFAEAYLQSYTEFGADPMEELDSRLPEDLMQRVQEIERQESGLHVAEKQVENQ